MANFRKTAAGHEPYVTRANNRYLQRFPRICVLTSLVKIRPLMLPEPPSVSE